MKLLLSIIALVTFCSNIYAEEEIYVQLSGETPLLPLYVSPLDGPQKALREVLAFDLNYNGMTRVLTQKESASKPSLKGQEGFDATPQFAALKKDDVLYLVKLKIESNALQAKVLSVNSHESRSINGITLTGDPEKDRAKVHALSNTIYEMLFGKKGIATSRILFTIKKQVKRPNQAPIWLSEVYEADYDGHNVRQLTFDNSMAATPRYIPGPNGAKPTSFLYVGYKIGQPKIYTAPLKGGSPARVSQLRGNQLTPSVSKNGSLIAFSADTTSKADIFIQSFSSKPRQIFAAKGAANASPTFSPDGKKIAFVSNKDGSPKIYVMSIPSEGMRLSDVKVSLISKRCRENSAPCWSPDGKKLAYCAKNSGERQIWVYDFETNQERELTQGKGIKENPSWAPDSLHLVFNATHGENTDLYLINLNQREAVKITSGPGAKMFPCWGT